MKSKGHALAYAVIIGILAVLTVSALFLLAPVPATAQADPAASKGQTQTTFDGCTYDWGRVTSPDPGGPGGVRLYTMSAVSASDVWAVGMQWNSQDGTRRGYVVHWDGSAWNTVATPSIGEPPYYVFTGVAAISSNNVWVSGYSCATNGCSTLIMRWDGSAFNIVSSPNVPSAGNSLWDIAAVSANDIWAVGKSNVDFSSNFRPLIVHWNGTVWSIVPSPDLGTQNGALVTVAAVSANDVWAVGNYNDSFGTVTSSFSLHWNGTAWNVVYMPAPGNSGEVTVNGATAISSNDVWAVGNFMDHSQGNDIRTLAYHWDGTSWSVVATPNHSDLWQENFINDISAISSNDVWAVGYWSDNGTQDLLYMHWDGSQWTMPFTPHTTDDDGLGGVVMISPTDAWSVGYGQHWDGTAYHDQPIVEHYTLQCITPSPTLPTSTSTNTPTNTSTNIPANTPTITRTVFASATPSATSTPAIGPPCPVAYADLPPGSSDFAYAHCATCNGILETFVCGSSQAEPCIPPTNFPYFRPAAGYAGIRGEVAKSLANAAGFNDPPAGQLFQDIAVGSTYYTSTYRLGERGMMQGFPCGGPGEPCVPPNNLPYFRPFGSAVRGEFARFLSNTAGFNDPPVGQQFEDVPPGSSFYTYTYELAIRSLMQGFPCGGPGEPCLPPDNLPYFRPNVLLSSVSRLEFAHILVNTFLPGCPLLTPTPTTTPSRTPTNTPTGVFTATPTRTSTPIPTQTPGGNTATSVASNTPTSVVTAAVTATATAAATGQPTACTIEFTDVPNGSTFYSYIRCLACRGIVSGYADGTFRPNNNVTRGQLSKIVSNSAGFSDPQPNQMFEDVPVGSTFQLYIGRLASRGYIGGYPCGDPGEPCGPGNLPYFRPNSNATRGQITKIDANAASYNSPPEGQQFQDLPPGATFYTYTFQLVSRGVMGGYPCGGTGEPCLPPDNLPYFRPNNNATRGQTSKIVANTFFPGCQTPQGIRR